MSAAGSSCSARRCCLAGGDALDRGVLGSLLGLAVLAWYIFLLWTTYSSPTKQGWHDKFVNSMVVKAARVVA